MFVALVIASIISALLVGPAFAWQLAKKVVHDVSGHFSREGLVWNLCVDTREEAIALLAEHAASAPGMPPASVVRAAVAEREAVMGTGVGRGVAIPHARLDNLPRPVVVTGVCPDGVEWDEVDGKPAHLVFLVLTRTGDDADTQLEILARIARLCSDPDFSRSVREAPDADAAWRRLEGALAEGT
jgi:mannitol/fructose-specific phosphotransferase system IIA component (Ntr-type)